MSTDIKLSRTQISKMIQSGGLLHNILGNLGKKVITNLAIPLARKDLPGLVSNLVSNAINRSEKKLVEKGFSEQEKDLKSLKSLELLKS